MEPLTFLEYAFVKARKICLESVDAGIVKNFRKFQYCANKLCYKIKNVYCLGGVKAVYYDGQESYCTITLRGKNLTEVLKPQIYNLVGEGAKSCTICHFAPLPQCLSIGYVRLRALLFCAEAKRFEKILL